MNNILKKSLVALCIMVSFCQTTDARWGEILRSTKTHCADHVDVVSTVFKDAKKESVGSIKNELKKCMDKTFSKKNIGNFLGSDEKTDRVINCFYLAGNIISAALDKTKVALSGNKNNIAQACEKILNSGKELVKNKACDLFNPVGIAVNVLNGNEIVTKVINECAKSEDIKCLSEQAAGVVEKVGINVIDSVQNCVNNVKNPKDRGESFQCIDLSDDWSEVVEIDQFSVNPIKIAGLDQSCFLNINETPSSKDLATVVIPAA